MSVSAQKATLVNQNGTRHVELSSELSDTSITGAELTLAVLSPYGSAVFWRFGDDGHCETFELSGGELEVLIASYRVHQRAIRKQQQQTETALPPYANDPHIPF